MIDYMFAFFGIHIIWVRNIIYFYLLQFQTLTFNVKISNLSENSSN